MLKSYEDEPSREREETHLLMCRVLRSRASVFACHHRQREVCTQLLARHCVQHGTQPLQSMHTQGMLFRFAGVTLCSDNHDAAALCCRHKMLVNDYIKYYGGAGYKVQ